MNQDYDDLKKKAKADLVDQLEEDILNLQELV
jgi:hypothetical protein